MNTVNYHRDLKDQLDWIKRMAIYYHSVGAFTDDYIMCQFLKSIADIPDKADGQMWTEEQFSSEFGPDTDTNDQGAWK